MKTKQGLPFLNVILFFSSLLYCLIVQAADSGRLWKNIGPKGATMQEVVFSQSNPEIVYALSKEKSRLYKSENGGKQWEEVKREGQHQFHSRGLIVDSANPQILLTITDSYNENGSRLKKSSLVFSRNFLHRSIDGGQHWSLVELSLDFGFLRYNSSVAKSLRAVVINEKGERRIAVSQDAGEHWTVSDNVIDSTKENQFVSIVAIDPDDSHVIYGTFFEANLGAGVLYKSKDGGSNWFKIQPSEFIGYASGPIIHPANNELLYSQFYVKGASTAQWHRSLDGGVSWQVIGQFGVKGFQSWLTLSSGDSSLLFITVLTENEHQLFNSTDFGETWVLTQSIDRNEVPLVHEQKIAINPLDKQHLLSTSYQGISSSKNGGKDWQNSSSGFKSERGGQLSIAQDDSTVMYFSPLVERKGVYFKSTTGGDEWERFTISNKMVNNKCQQFIINPANNSDIICLTFEQGNTYSDVSTLFRTQVYTDFC